MRIAVIVPEFPGITQTFTYIRLGSLAERGIHVKLFYSKEGDLSLLDSKLVKRMKIAGVESTKLPGDRLSLSTFFKLVITRKMFENLCISTKYLYKQNQVNSIRKAGSSLLRFAPLLFWQPDVIHIETSYLIHGMLNALEGMGTPILISLRGADVDEKPLTSTTWRSFYSTSMDRPLIFFHCVSEHIRRKAIELGVPQEKCETIHLGVTKKGIEEENYPNLADDKVTKIITVARLSHEKGVELAIQAINYLHKEGFQIQYNIIGDGPERSDLEKTVQDLNLGDYVIFWGAKTNDWVRNYLFENSGNSIYLQPSRFEAFATAILEAMFSGLPVVVTNVGGNPEIVSDGISGLLCKPDDPISMAENIENLMLDGELRQRVRIYGYNFATKEFSADAEAEKFMKLFSQLINKNNPGKK